MRREWRPDSVVPICVSHPKIVSNACCPAMKTNQLTGDVRLMHRQCYANLTYVNVVIFPPCLGSGPPNSTVPTKPVSFCTCSSIRVIDLGKQSCALLVERIVTIVCFKFGIDTHLWYACAFAWRFRSSGSTTSKSSSSAPISSSDASSSSRRLLTSALT